MKNIIIGTAGHIDHGKTTLIKALTGRNTDRWLEEQRRGITIDLGFTWFDLPDGNRAGIVDVPGHEKFIHNMVAGVVGMDLVLLVIAADEGIMPQTREHMDILHLLGIQKSIIVLNKCDLVEEDWLELMEEEIREELQGTFLEQAPMIPVSAVTGQGLEHLIETISRMTSEEIEPRDIHTIPRLPIDRVFTMSGFGTIVSGTLVSGTMTTEDVLELYPTGKECRIRNIQVHGADTTECQAGQRVAINISNLKKDEIKRGYVLAPRNSMKNTDVLDVKLSLLESSNRTLENRARLHLFTGTSEVLCRAVLLDCDTLEPGESCFAQLRLEEKIAVRRGDKFVVRFYSPLETIGGGVVLEANPRIKRRHKPEIIEELKRKEAGSSADMIEMQVKTHADTMITVAEIARLTAMSEEEVKQDVDSLVEEGSIYCFSMKKDQFLWHRDAFEEAKRKLPKLLLEYQNRHPYQHGAKKAEIQTSQFKKIKPNVLDLALEEMQNQQVLRREGEYLCTADFEIPKDETFCIVENQLVTAMEQAGYDFVKYSEMDFGKISREWADDILNVLREEQILVKMSDDLYTTKALADTAAERIREMLEKEDIITISQVRDTFGNSRKNTKAILEYTDSIKISRKTGSETEWKKY